MRQKLRELGRTRSLGREMRSAFKVFECKGILILFCRIQLDLGGFFLFLFPVSEKVNGISLCFAKVNFSRAVHKVFLKKNGGC